MAGFGALAHLDFDHAHLRVLRLNGKAFRVETAIGRAAAEIAAADLPDQIAAGALLVFQDDGEVAGRDRVLSRGVDGGGAVGVGLALLGENIWLIAACIGLTTFALATLGLLIGKAAGTRLGKIVELVGGVALIALGLKILLEHLGVIA